MRRRGRLGAALAVAAAALIGLPAPVAADQTLRILTWEGYTDPSFTDAFEIETGCEVRTIVVGRNDDFFSRLLAGLGDFDLVSPSIDTTSILVKLGLIEPIVASWVWRFPEIYPALREHPGIQTNGELWAVPFAWSPITLLYRTDKVREPPDSWAALWDPAFAGKIALFDDKSSLYMTARLLFGSETEAFDLDDAALHAVREKLTAQKPLLRKYWGSATELISLYITGDVWISDSWGRVEGPLRDQGLPMASVVPRERANAWADAWQIVRGAENLDCAYAWLNFSLSAQAQCGVQAVTGFSGANPVALANCAEAEPVPAAEQIAEYVFWREPERLLRYIDSWTAIKAAE